MPYADSKKCVHCERCFVSDSDGFALCKRCRESSKGKLRVAVGNGSMVVERTISREAFDKLCEVPELAEREIPVYQWGMWPEHLLTKAQMSEAGLQTGKKLPAPMGKVYRSKSPGGVMWLYDRNQGIARATISPEQKANLDAARVKSRSGWRCGRCGDALPYYIRGGGLCKCCSDWNAAGVWASDVLQHLDEVVILDTETTGLRAGHHEIIQIALADGRGATMLDTLVKALHPERMYEGDPCAFDIHGISAEQLADAPTWGDVWWKVQALAKGKRLLIYNAQFDIGMMGGMCALHGVDYQPTWDAVDCVMEQYAAWCGEWSRYYGSYRWQPLDGGHSALEDCHAALGVIRHMAAEYK